ncbi:MAG: NAD(P)/FAD-dependent oxidoreductase [Chloroflexi bacterium]|nr:NAD(P)/FAD-dependent oxidoreductase [Chloroflexota bacterium]
MARVVIAGMGFGGLRAAKGLAGSGLEVLLLDQYNYHLFHPLLYQVATASVEQENIAYPIRAIFRSWRNVRFRLARVEGVDLGTNRVLTDSGPIDYDYLVLSVGSASEFYGLDAVRRIAHTLKDMDDAVDLRNQILSCFERASIEPDPAKRAALLTFVIVGGGPTGVEFSGALAELVRHALRKDYPELERDSVRIVLVEALPNLLPLFSNSLREYARHRLERLGVKVRTGQPVVEARPDGVVLRDGTEIAAYTLFWAAGVRAAPLTETLPGAKDRVGRLIVRPDLRHPDYDNVFVIGDMAHVEQGGKVLPMLAPVAMQEGAYVAAAILAQESGREMAPFRYRDKGQMAIIGRNAAVAHAFGIQMRGFLAWLAWLALHLYYLIGFRNRLFALLNWAYAYLLLDPKLRLITRPLPKPGSEGNEEVVKGGERR